MRYESDRHRRVALSDRPAAPCDQEKNGTVANAGFYQAFLLIENLEAVKPDDQLIGIDATVWIEMGERRALDRAHGLIAVGVDANGVP
jgi:hypothetical protein